MCCDERICSAKAAIGDCEIGSYPLFESSVEEKRVAIWQPRDRVNNLYQSPEPANGLREKANAFLRRAVDQEAHLGLAPEWAYNLEWVADHDEYLFAEEGPLFVLGCAQIEHATMEAVLNDLEDEYTCIPADVPEDDSNQLLTPTIIPIRGVSDGEERAEKILLIQYKNHPLGDSDNPREELDLIEGDFVWKIDPEQPQLEVLALTCSDLLDWDLQDEATEFARSTNSIVAHVQCNPKPFHEIWTRFRRRLFGADNRHVTYVTANWGNVRSSIGNIPCGYSGVYTKAPRHTPLDNYNEIITNGGLPATKPSEYCEMVWLVTDEDTMSLLRFNRADPASPAAAGPSFADPHISTTWTWDGDTYVQDHPGVPECDEDECEEWASLLPDRPLDIELISSVAQGKVKTDRLDDVDTLVPPRDINWAILSNLRTGPQERASHTLAKHRHRGGPRPPDVSATLQTAFRLADEEGNIVPIDEIDMADLPVNADYSDPNRQVPISLTIIENSSDAAWLRRLQWINEWFQIQQDDDDETSKPPFKPVVVRMHENGEYRFKELREYERVDGRTPDPEQVDPTGGIRGGNQ
jgi:hypothetical protein